MKLDCVVVVLCRITCSGPMIRGFNIVFVTRVSITLHKRMPLRSSTYEERRRSNWDSVVTSEWLRIVDEGDCTLQRCCGYIAQVEAPASLCLPLICV